MTARPSEALVVHRVIEDSRGRFQPGDWVRSNMHIIRR
ncbi:DUF6957 family protein [Pseudomonas fluorescens]